MTRILHVAAAADAVLLLPPLLVVRRFGGLERRRRVVVQRRLVCVVVVARGRAVVGRGAIATASAAARRAAAIDTRPVGGIGFLDLAQKLRLRRNRLDLSHRRFLLRGEKGGGRLLLLVTRRLGRQGERQLSGKCIKNADFGGEMFLQNSRGSASLRRLRNSRVAPSRTPSCIDRPKPGLEHHSPACSIMILDWQFQCRQNQARRRRTS